MALMTPSTPPRGNRVQAQTPFTPKTPGSSISHNPVKKDVHLKTPHSRNSRVMETNQLTPDPTPQHRKRKQLSDAISLSTTSSTSTASSRQESKPTYLFPPAQPRIGSGRSLSARRASIDSRQGLRKCAMSPVLSDSIQFESSDEEIEGLQLKSQKPTIRMLNFNDINSDEEEHQDHMQREPPRTPTKKIINEELAKQWNNPSSYNTKLSSENDNDIFITRSKPTNPFIGPPKTGSNTFLQDTDEIVYIHNKTGERIVRKLSEEQKRIKPKILDFSSAALDTDEEIGEDNQDHKNLVRRSTEFVKDITVSPKGKNFTVFKDS
ncbi:BA75_04695T0 [Komagataella pastoris]|uniref:BA75_04695T0 n=1 Tax=Komagataella pastoris TaxID=4922 RepID=A0A1B2JJ00_PICPA|nr:BA75_04695T0 [Komagataella pastoris]